MDHKRGSCMSLTFASIPTVVDYVEKATTPTSRLGIHLHTSSTLGHTIPLPEWPQELKDLCMEFEDVLVKELEQAQNITCPPMDVELQASVKPCFTRKPRNTPLHWAYKVKKEVEKLLKAGIIERILANKQALCISPAGFMAKDEKEEKLRFICDLRQLNKGVKSDSSIFPTPNEVMQSLRLALK